MNVYFSRPRMTHYSGPRKPDSRVSYDEAVQERRNDGTQAEDTLGDVRGPGGPGGAERGQDGQRVGRPASGPLHTDPPKLGHCSLAAKGVSRDAATRRMVSPYSPHGPMATTPANRFTSMVETIVGRLSTTISHPLFTTSHAHSRRDRSDGRRRRAGDRRAARDVQAAPPGFISARGRKHTPSAGRP